MVLKTSFLRVTSSDKRLQQPGFLDEGAEDTIYRNLCVCQCLSAFLCNLSSWQKQSIFINCLFDITNIFLMSVPGTASRVCMNNGLWLKFLLPENYQNYLYVAVSLENFQNYVVYSLENFQSYVVYSVEIFHNCCLLYREFSELCCLLSGEFS